MDMFGKFPIFRGLAPDEAVALRGISQETRLAKGATIFSEGEAGDSAFLLMSGQVEVRKRIGDGDRALATLAAGTILGEIALLDSAPRTATAVATEDVRLLKVARATFLELTAAQPTIGARVFANMARLLAHRLRTLDEEFARSVTAVPPAQREEITTLLRRSTV